MGGVAVVATCFGGCERSLGVSGVSEAAQRSRRSSARDALVATLKRSRRSNARDALARATLKRARR